MRTLNGLRDIANDMNKSTEQLLYEMLCDCMNENQGLKQRLDYALKLLSEIYPPCDIDGFMDRHSDYCQINCGVDEEVFKNCWYLYIEDKIKEIK